VPGRQGPRFARLGVDLATEPLVLDGQLHRCGHCLHQVRIVENRAGMHERGHGSAVALEEGHRAAFAVGGQGGRPPCSIEVPAGRIGPVEDGKGGIAQSHPEAALELRRSVDLAELDHEPARGGRAHLSL